MNTLLLSLLRYSGYYVRGAASTVMGPLLFRTILRAQRRPYPGGAVVLSFDVDFPADVTVLPRLARDLADRRLRGSFAVVGQWVDEYPEEHRALVEFGHEIINHTYTHPRLRNVDYDFSASDQFTEQRFESLSDAERLTEIRQCHEAVSKILRIQMTGCRLPHFGNLEPRLVYKLLAEVGYRFSTSALAGLSPRGGVPFRPVEGLWEIPVTGCPRHPFTVFDTWHCLVKNGGRHSRPGEFARLFRSALDQVQRHAALLNVYFDPKDVAGSAEFFAILDDINARTDCRTLTYEDLSGV